MKFKEVKLLNENPDWLIEILVEFKEKKEENIISQISKPEIKQDVSKDIIKKKMKKVFLKKMKIVFLKKKKNQLI